MSGHPPAGSARSTLPRVDSHQHFWRLARGDYGWLNPQAPQLAPIYRDFLPEHLQPILRSNLVSQTVLVQAADTEEETAFLLELAAAYSFIGGVVGWIDLSTPASVRTLDRWARHPKFKGVRPMLQDLPADDWIAWAPHPDVVQALVRLSLRLDALVRPQHLEPLLRFVQAYPDLPVVIDHAAKPQLGQGWDAAWAGTWRRWLEQIAAHPQVNCKFSGLLTELAAPALRSGATHLSAVRPVWNTLLQWFGPKRLMWGSDWPVLSLAGDYAGWTNLCGTLFGELSSGEQDLVWQGCASRFYGLDAAERPADGRTVRR